MIKSAFSEIIRSFEVLGNERITKETIKVYADIKLGSDYQADDINKIVKTLYSTEFFENIEAKFENNKLTLTVKEYPIINQIVIKGEKTEKFKKEIMLWILCSLFLFFPKIFKHKFIFAYDLISFFFITVIY